VKKCSSLVHIGPDRSFGRRRTGVGARDHIAADGFDPEASDWRVEMTRGEDRRHGETPLPQSVVT
jgi:hypothetical protein